MFHFLMALRKHAHLGGSDNVNIYFTLVPAAWQGWVGRTVRQLGHFEDRLEP
jgi:hypothetical protein